MQVIWIWNSKSSHSTACSCEELRVNLSNRKCTGFWSSSGIFCSSLNYITLLGHLSLLDIHIAVWYLNAGYRGFVCFVPQEKF